jgi:hypothetical protein
MLKLHPPAMRRVPLGVETGDWETDVREHDVWLPNSLETLSCRLWAQERTCLCFDVILESQMDDRQERKQ